MNKALTNHLADVKAKKTAFMPEMAFTLIWEAIAPILASVGKQGALALLQLAMDRVAKWEAGNAPGS